VCGSGCDALQIQVVVWSNVAQLPWQRLTPRCRGTHLSSDELSTWWLPSWQVVIVALSNMEKIAS